MMILFPFVSLCLIPLPMSLPSEPESPFLNAGDAEDNVVKTSKFFRDLEALFRRSAVIDSIEYVALYLEAILQVWINHKIFG